MASIAANFREFYSYQFQMLIAPPGTLSWVPHPSDSPFPDGAVIGGRMPMWNATVYVCRTSPTTNPDNDVIPGFISPNHTNANSCYFPFHEYWPTKVQQNTVSVGKMIYVNFRETNAVFTSSNGLVNFVNVTKDNLCIENWEPAGVENGTNLYLARDYHYDDATRSWHYLNGKLEIRPEIKASIATNARGYSYDQFQMLSAPPGVLSWIPHPLDSPFPDGAVIGGFVPRWNTSVYVCRTSLTSTTDYNIIPGFIFPGHGNPNNCYFPFQGDEHESKQNVELLVINPFGKMTGTVQEG